MNKALETLTTEINACTLCAGRFAETATAHKPRPVPWLSPSAKILIAGQAPGMRVQKSGIPFDDPSGDRLRDWLGVDKAQFYNKDNFAILPMAFCFPGYNLAGSDLPPPPICAKTWRTQVLQAMPQVELILLVGGHAQNWHLGKGTVSDRVLNWRDHMPMFLPLPHPSWRNTGWLKQRPWFETDLLSVLRSRVKEVLK
jgi:uracil-DNA glycosylase